MPALSDRDALRKARALRNEALNNLARQHFANIAIETESYISGDGQIPEGHTRDDYRASGYRIVNLESDLTDRITAMLAGRLNVAMRAIDGSPSVLERMCMALFNELKRAIHFSGVLFEWTSDGVTFNIGVARCYYDPARMKHRGGYIGVETPHPLSIWISPYARNPYHPLLGSEYLGYETLKTRGQLKAEYPKLARKIARLPAFVSNSQISDQFDPVYSLTQPFGGGDTRSTNEGNDDWTPVSSTEADGSGEPNGNPRDDDRIRVLELVYEAQEMVDLGPDVQEPVMTYRTFTILGDLSGKTGDALVADPDTAVPYDLPMTVLFIYRRSKSSAYGSGGAPAGVHDLQDGFNTLYSQVMDELQEDATWKQVIFKRAGVLSEDDDYKLTNGSGPRTITLDPEREYQDNVPLNQLLMRFEDIDTDWSKKLELLQWHQAAMRTQMGVGSAVIGDEPVKPRTSGIAISSTQQATLIAQEPARQHLNAAARNLASTLWAMIKYHWILPQTINLDDGMTVEINTRVPVTPETTAKVEELLATPDPRGDDGRPLVPSALHVDGPDGGEVVIPVSEKEIVQQVLSGKAGYDVQTAEWSFNFLPLVDIEIEMTVEGDAKEKAEQRRNAMSWAATLPKGDISWETKMTEAMGDNERWSPALERKRLYGDDIANILTQAQALGPQAQQMLTQVIQQTIAQLQMQGGAPGTAPGGGMNPMNGGVTSASPPALVPTPGGQPSPGGSNGAG